MTHQEQCARLAELSGQMDAILAAADKDNRPLTDEEKVAFDGMDQEAEGLKVTIDAHKADQLRREKAKAYAAKVDEPATVVPKEIPGGIAAKPEQARISMPRYRGKLMVFSGINAHENAYKAGQQLLAITGNANAMRWCKEHLANVHTEGSNVHGGYLVVDEFESAVIEQMESYGVFRREADIMPMASDTKIIPRRKSGLDAYFVAEAAALTESDAEWDQIQLVAKKLAVMARYSSELSEDAVIDIADRLAREAAYALAKKEDQCGFIGTGASTYGGIYGLAVKIDDTSGATYAGSIKTAATGNTAFGTLDLTDFEAVVGALPEYAESTAKWFISKAGWAASMLRLVDAAGGNTGDMIAGRTPATFLGYPVVWSSVLNSTLTAQTSTVLALFGDMRMTSKMGVRRGIRVKMSDQRYIEYDQLAFQVTERFDVNNVVGDPESPTTAAGPMIALKTPGS